MPSRIIFSIIMAFVASCLLAQETDSVATKVEEAYVMPRHSVHYEIGGAANGAGVFYAAASPLCPPRRASTSRTE